MAIITLLTDSGDNDHYVAAIKAKILSFNPSVTIIDISHRIPPFDIAQGAFLLRAVFRDFPSGAAHLVGVNAIGDPGCPFVALQMEGHFFVGSDNGLFSLVGSSGYQNAVNLSARIPAESTFPERDILALAAAKLASRVAISSLGTPITLLKKMVDRQVKATPREVVGRVIYVDHYGNLITNISRSVFEPLSKDKKILITLGGERFNQIHENYNRVEAGDCFLIFNAQSLLEIGINKGRANELLGLGYDSPIHIRFENQA